jgi:hypothetical protein
VLFLDTTLCRSRFGCRSFRGSAVGRRALFVRALLFLCTAFLGCEPLLDRALHRGVLRGGALFLLGTALLRDASILRGALGRGAILSGATLIELTRFRCCSALGRGAFRGSALFRGALLRRASLLSCPLRRFDFVGGASLFGGAALLRYAAVLRGARVGGSQLGCPALFLREPLFHFASFHFDAARLRSATFVFGAQVCSDALVFRAARFFRETCFFRDARFFRDTGFLTKTRFLSTPRVLRSSLCGDACVFGQALRRDPLLFEALRLRGSARGWEDLFVLQEREDLVIFDLHDRVAHDVLFLGRLLRSLARVALRDCRLLRPRRPCLFDARLGLRRDALDGSRGRATVF